MDTPLQLDFPTRRHPVHGTGHPTGPRPRSAILGSITIPGRPEEVSGARRFILRTLAAAGKGATVDSDAAALLTSELVTNALLHTNSGRPGGTITIVVVNVPDGALIEVIDDGSAGMPVVKGDLLAAHGRGLHLVQQIAAQWGYLRDKGGTTVWFHLAGAACPDRLGHAAAAARGQPAAATAARTPAQIAARSSSPVMYGGIV